MTLANSTVFSPTCIDLQLSELPYTRFRQVRSSVYSSIFVQTIAPGPYDVLDNQDSIIGMLRMPSFAMQYVR